MTIAEGQGTSENQKGGVKPTQPKTDSSGYFGIPKLNFNEIYPQHLMLKKYAVLGSILLCYFTSSGNCTTKYDEDNYWSKHGRYGRDHRHDDDHHKHKHNHDKDKHHKHKDKHHKHHKDKHQDKHSHDKHGHSKHH